MGIVEELLEAWTIADKHEQETGSSILKDALKRYEATINFSTKDINDMNETIMSNVVVDVLDY